METDPVLQRGVWHLYSVIVTGLWLAAWWHMTAAVCAVMIEPDREAFSRYGSRLLLALLAMAVWCAAWRVDYVISLDK